MLDQQARKRLEDQADRKCEDFQAIMTWIRDAGICGDDPDTEILLFDLDGNLWKKQPREMNPDDILEYVQHRFGDLFVSFCRRFPFMTLH